MQKQMRFTWNQCYSCQKLQKRPKNCN